MLIELIPTLLLAFSPLCVDPHPLADLGASFTASVAMPRIATGGRTFTSREGRFSVAVPSGFSPFETRAVTSDLPLQPDSDDESDKPKLTMVLSFSANARSKAAVAAAYIDYPRKMTDSMTVEMMLNGASAWAARKYNCSIEDTREITLDGFPGRSILLSGGDEFGKMSCRANFYLVNGRLYEVAVVSMGKKEFLDSRDARGIFSSFKLIGTKKAR